MPFCNGVQTVTRILLLSTEYPIYQQIARVLLAGRVPFFNSRDDGIRGAEIGFVLFEEQLVLTAGEGAAGGFEQTEAGIGDFLQDWGGEPVAEIGLEEVGEAFGLPVAAGEGGEVGFVLDFGGRIVGLEAREELVEEALVFDGEGGAGFHWGSGMGVGAGIGFVWSMPVERVKPR